MTLSLGRIFPQSHVTHAIKERADFAMRVLRADRLTDFRDVGAAGSTIRNLSHFRLGGMEIEIIEPRRDVTGPIYLADVRTDVALSFHHIGFLVDTQEEWHTALADARDRAILVPVCEERPPACFAYFDTRVQTGRFVEVVYRAPGVGTGGLPTHGVVAKE